VSDPHADLEVLRRVMREGAVDQTPASPGLTDYVVAVLEAFARWLHRHAPGLHWVWPAARGLGRALTVAAIVLVLAVLVLVVRTVLAGRRSRAPRVAAAPRRVATPSAPPERSRLEWREEIERRLRAGDVGGALEALWWWFARGVSAARVDPAWTSRELLANARRPELAPLALGLDRLLYAAERPRADAVRAFLRHSEETLA
jgi:hypothetical protein